MPETRHCPEAEFQNCFPVLSGTTLLSHPSTSPPGEQQHKSERNHSERPKVLLQAQASWRSLGDLLTSVERNGTPEAAAPPGCHKCRFSTNRPGPQDSVISRYSLCSRQRRKRCSTAGDAVRKNGCRGICSDSKCCFWQGG